MPFDAYTPDVICRSMGIPAFIEPAWTAFGSSSLRILLKPSIHPEVCITLEARSDGVRLSVVALEEMLWRKIMPQRMSYCVHSAMLPVECFTDWDMEFTAAAAAFALPRSIVILDGMPVVVGRVIQGRAETIEGHPNHPATKRLVRRLLLLAWNECWMPGVRNRLAGCARHVGLDLPRIPQPLTKKTYRIGVFGTPDERAEYFRLVERGVHSR